LVSSVQQSLAELITVRDAEGPPALDEATRRLGMLTNKQASNADSLAQAQRAVDRLTAALQGANTLLNAAGPPRLGPGSPGLTMPPITSCDLKQSPGLTPLIDDF